MLGVVLVLACLNVATLLLSRSETRRQEIATRFALGAGRWRVVRQLVTEAGLIAEFGGALGLVLAWWGSRVLLSLATHNSVPLPLDLAPSLSVIGFTAAVSGLSCLVVGVLPALRSTALGPGPATREIGSRKRRLLDRVLVGSQVALSMVLLSSPGCSSAASRTSGQSIPATTGATCSCSRSMPTLRASEGGTSQEHIGGYWISWPACLLCGP
jgi:predicted lysophospholipase L1 biosynthesis ABC-type transport system permease subunit